MDTRFLGYRRREESSNLRSAQHPELDGATGGQPATALSLFYARLASREQKLRSLARQRVGVRSKTALSAPHRFAPDLIRAEAGGQTKNYLSNSYISVVTDF